MARFFKREEKRPFNYPAIEEYKGGSKHLLWYFALVVVIIFAIIYFLLSKYI